MPRYRVDATYREYRVYFVEAGSADAAEDLVLEGNAPMFSNKLDQFYVNSIISQESAKGLCSICRREHGLEIIHESE